MPRQCQTWDYNSLFSDCHNSSSIRRKLFDEIKLVDETLSQLNEESLLTVILFGSKIYKEQLNVQILSERVGYIYESNWFLGSFF